MNRDISRKTGPLTPPITSLSILPPLSPSLSVQSPPIFLNNSTQPLNLTKSLNDQIQDNLRKRSFNDDLIARDVANHPQNPEKSAIKDLLLNANSWGALPPNEADERFTCPFCKVRFSSAENLKFHTICYCQGSQANSPQAASRSGSPSYFRSNSLNDKNNPNSLAKLASTSLRRCPIKNQPNQPSSLVQIVKSQVKLPKIKVENIIINSAGEGTSKSIDMIQAPLPSPGPFLGKTRLVDSYNSDKIFDEVSIRIVPPQPTNETPSTSAITIEHTFALPEEISPIRRNMNQNQHLQMYGGEVQVIDKKCDNFISYGSGGSVTSLSPTSQSESEPSPILIPPGYFSGGSGIQLPQKEKTPQTPKLMTPNLTPSMMVSPITHFQFPPINSITDYNPLTLPPIQNVTSVGGQASTIFHGGKMIPFVPGIPGPNTHTLQPKIDRSIQRVISPNLLKKSPLSLPNNSSHHQQQQQHISRISPTPNIMRVIPNIKIIDGCDSPKKKKNMHTTKNGIIDNLWTSPKHETKKFRRIENTSPSPRKLSGRSPELTEYRHFNYENLISKSSIPIKPPDSTRPSKQLSPLHIDIANNQIIKDKEMPSPAAPIDNHKSSKFLRPTSLPLKPGSFQQKKHHGITPTQNTMPLISPETPRPSKNCVQLYLNGHAYTYLGLKCSTKMTYCTLNRAQPVYITNQHKLSMYSEWRVHDDFNPHHLGIKPGEAISLYDSRHRNSKYSIVKMPSTLIVVHSQTTIMTPFENSNLIKFSPFAHHQVTQIKQKSLLNETSIPITSPSSSSSNILATIPGGYESNEDYTYVRGRGRGRYVCSECGIRCKKPSMLKKHIRTHTDVRPYTCKMCSFR